MNTDPHSICVGSVVSPYPRSLRLGAIAWLLASQAAFALDINQANEAELDSVKGMGPSLSTTVLTARAQGPFKDWADLMQRVSGIRHHKAEQFSAQGLTVNGQPFGAKR